MTMTWPWLDGFISFEMHVSAGVCFAPHGHFRCVISHGLDRIGLQSQRRFRHESSGRQTHHAERNAARHPCTRALVPTPTQLDNIGKIRYQISNIHQAREKQTKFRRTMPSAARHSSIVFQATLLPGVPPCTGNMAVWTADNLVWFCTGKRLEMSSSTHRLPGLASAWGPDLQIAFHS